jgi:plastocyanin
MPPPSEVTFYLSGVEYKGSTTIESLVAPTEDPANLAPAYRYKGPGHDSSSPTKWEVSVYQWSPNAMTAFQGDTVRLVFFAANGDKHTTNIIGPDGEEIMPAQVINRGRQFEYVFKAEAVGMYFIGCTDHRPNMTAALAVIPRS